MGFAFEDATIDTRRGPRRALVMAPEAAYLVGRERLEELRRGGESPIDESVAAHFATRALAGREPYRVVVFRGRHSGRHDWSWRLDERLDAPDLQELCWRLAAKQLTIWRDMLRRGAWVMVHTDLGSSAAPLRQGVRALIDDPRRLEGVAPEIQEIDEWILRHLVFYFSGSFETAMAETLPDKLPLVEARRERLEAFAERLEAHAQG